MLELSEVVEDKTSEELGISEELIFSEETKELILPVEVSEDGFTKLSTEDVLLLESVLCVTEELLTVRLFCDDMIKTQATTVSEYITATVNAIKSTVVRLSRLVLAKPFPPLK